MSRLVCCRTSQPSGSATRPRRRGAAASRAAACRPPRAPPPPGATVAAGAWPAHRRSDRRRAATRGAGRDDACRRRRRPSVTSSGFAVRHARRDRLERGASCPSTTNTPRLPSQSTTALRGTISASARSSTDELHARVHAGLQPDGRVRDLDFHLAPCASPGSRTGATRATRPMNVSPGNASTSTTAGMPTRSRRRSFSTTFATRRTEVDVDDRDERRVRCDKRAGIEAALADEAVDRRDDARCSRG